ncbi:MAG: helix-turn-helix transcriptional regulator [Crocinitomicaceae bacterium]
MIPIHDFSSEFLGNIRVVELEQELHYNTSEPHRHNYFELFIFEKGGGDHLIDFDSFPVAENTVHIVAPGKVHQMRRMPNSKGYVIHFDTTIASENNTITEFLFDQICYNNSEMSPSYQFDLETGEQILRTAKLIKSDFDSDNALKTEFLKNHLFLICILCMRNIPDRSTSMGKNQDVYQSFRRMLRNHYKEIKKVKDYAAELNVSEKLLNEIVNNKTGFSCSQLIYNQIILEAKRLLRTNISTKETAFALNFEDPAHFSKFFKSQTGISPSEFQKVHA